MSVEIIGNSLSRSPDGSNCRFRRSASASLDLPHGAAVVQAFLYWSASGVARAASEVRFNGRAVSSDAIYSMALGKLHYYGARADVTKFVSSSGIYRVSGIEIATYGFCDLPGGAAYGAWSLIVVYEMPTLINARMNVCFTPMTVDFNGVAEDGCVAAVWKRDQVAVLRFVAFEGDPEFDDSEMFINEQTVGANLFQGSVAPNLDIGTIDISHVTAVPTDTLKFEIVNARDSVLIPIRVMHQSL